MPKPSIKIKKTGADGIKIPRVYIEEISTVRTFADAETSTAAFLGSSAKGPVSKALLVKSFADFERTFGGLRAKFELGYAVRLYFANGGTQAWIARIPSKATRPQVEKGLKILNAASPVNMLLIPGASDRAVLARAEIWCRERRAFFIIDAPRAATPSQMLDARAASLPESNCAAVYYPWIAVDDPLKASKPRLTPPGGAVAGLFARTDKTRGVWKAPAGREPLKLVRSLEIPLTDRDQELLNPEAVNCLRHIQGTGFCVWGSRTLSGAGDADGEYKYVPVRRLAFYIERSIKERIRRIVFGPNDEPLWAKVRESVENFMAGLWRKGALMGIKPEQAFFVQCGRDTMTAADIKSGRFNLLLGFAPLKPAEFIILKISREK